jgi:putative transcriptional regulator
MNWTLVGDRYLRCIGSEPSRVFTVEGPDVKSIRCKLRVTQSDFATMLGISVRTLENWEQRRRTPRGSARVLLQIAEDPGP